MADGICEQPLNADDKNHNLWFKISQVRRKKGGEEGSVMKAEDIEGYRGKEDIDAILSFIEAEVLYLFTCEFLISDQLQLESIYIFYIYFMFFRRAAKRRSLQKRLSTRALARRRLRKRRK